MKRRLGRLLGYVAWGLLFWLGGCATIATPLPDGVRNGEEQAVHIIWVETYGRSDRPPLVRWLQGDALSCTDPISGKPGFPQFDAHAKPVCREGFTMSTLETLVAYHGEQSLAQTVLAHELEHVDQARRFIFDTEHRGVEWVALEECKEGAPPECGIVDRANRNVMAAGR